jgi:hypothetical protein
VDTGGGACTPGLVSACLAGKLTSDPSRRIRTLFDSGRMDRQPVEHKPDQWRGEYDGHSFRHDGEPIPVTVTVTWTDGTEREVNAWTRQWTRTHGCVSRESAPPYHPFWVRASDVRRREARRLARRRRTTAARSQSL